MCLFKQLCSMISLKEEFLMFKFSKYAFHHTVQPVHTVMAWGQSFIPLWTGSDLDMFFSFCGRTNNGNLCK